MVGVNFYITFIVSYFLWNYNTVWEILKVCDAVVEVALCFRGDQRRLEEIYKKCQTLKIDAQVRLRNPKMHSSIFLSPVNYAPVFGIVYLRKAFGIPRPSLGPF